MRKYAHSTIKNHFMKTNRRKFLSTSMKVSTAGLILSKIPMEFFETAKAAGMPLGFQSWTIKDKLSADFPGTLKMMADMGYKLIEMCSPKGYEQIGFGAFTKMKTADIRKTIEDAGMKCPSCHFGFTEFNDENIDDRIQFAKDMGMTQMICSTFWLPKTAALSDYMTAADKLNKAAEKINKAGLQTGFHNHDFEFVKLDDKLIYDELVNRFDPKLVKLQFQTQVIVHGYKAADYFKKYPGRFISAHLSDWSADKKEMPIGQGVIDWNEFFAALKTGGVKNMFVEMAPDKFKDSATYIQQKQKA